MPEFTLACLQDAERLALAEAESAPYPWSALLYASSLSGDHDRIWLMSEHGQLQGAAVVMQVLDEAHLQNFFIHRRYQGQGLARLLLAHVQASARQAGASCMFLEVRHSNHVARHLYQGAGFHAYHTRKAYYHNAEGSREDAVLMKATL